MYHIQLMLTKLGILDISIKMISNWLSSSFIKGIHYALIKADKHIRVLAIEGIVELKSNKTFLPILEEKINSPFLTESWSAIQSFEKICKKHKQVITLETQASIDKARKICENYFQAMREHTSANFDYGFDSTHQRLANVLKQNQMGSFPGIQ